MSTKPIKTKAQEAKLKRNEQIKTDYFMLIKIHGSSKVGVAEHLARKYKVSTRTVFRCTLS
jgi:hypothetical protein